MSNPAFEGRRIARNPNGYMAVATRAAELEREGAIRHGSVGDGQRGCQNVINQHWAPGPRRPNA